MKKIGLFAIFFFLSATSVGAVATLYFDEGSQTVVDYTHSVNVYIATQGDTITAFQAIINLPSTALGYESLDFIDYADSLYTVGTKPNCTHSLLPPEWGYVNKSSPYVFEDKLYIACGFPNPGYATQGTGDKLVTLTFYADAVGTDTLSFEPGSVVFYANGNTITTGTLASYGITVASAVEATPAPGTIPEKATDSITESDLNFVEVNNSGVRSTSGASTQTVTQSTGTSGDLEVVEEDDTIPPPPENVERRSLPQSLLDRIRAMSQEQAEEGEVLSAQSLRELLIPGKSDADKRVVWVNLLSLIVSLIIIAILAWRFIVMKRQSKMKSSHLSEMLAGELAAIESKMGGPVKDQELSQKLNSTIEQIKKEFKE